MTEHRCEKLGIGGSIEYMEQFNFWKFSTFDVEIPILYCPYCGADLEAQRKEKEK